MSPENKKGPKHPLHVMYEMEMTAVHDNAEGKCGILTELTSNSGFVQQWQKLSQSTHPNLTN